MKEKGIILPDGSAAFVVAIESKKCIVCGFENNPHNTRCYKCGYPLDLKEKDLR
jgi:ribosomal protein L40E